MRITRASIKGFLGIDRADIQLGHVNVFYGYNGVGKSSILEAILLPIFGETPRQSVKKEWFHMIRYGHRNADLFVQVQEDKDGAVMAHDLGGKINPKSHSIKALKKPDLYDRVLLDPLEFFNLPAKIKADLAGDVRLNPEDVWKALDNRGLGTSWVDKVADIIIEHKLSGAEKVLEIKRLEASRATSNPGPRPEFVWNANPMPEVDSTSQEKLNEYNNNAQQWVERATRLKDDLRNVHARAAEINRRGLIRSENERMLAEMNVPIKFIRVDELCQSNSRISELQEQLSNLNMDLQRMASEICPTCNQTWVRGGRDIQGQINDVEVCLHAEREVNGKLLGEKYEWEARVNKQSVAQNAIRNIDSLPPIPDARPEVEIQQDLDQADKSARESLEWANLIGQHLATLRYWKQRVEDSETAKIVRAEWDKAVSIIRDPTFKAELVQDPLQRIRDRLTKTCTLFRMEVGVSDALEVYVNARPWWLLSTAQKLQASVLLADAFAHAGGSKILKIDGVDTLVGRFQEDLIYFLQNVKDDYDTVLLALALGDETPPAFKIVEEIKAAVESAGGTHTPLAKWFWVHIDDLEGATVSFRREM